MVKDLEYLISTTRLRGHATIHSKKEQNHEDETACGKTSNKKQLHVVRTRMEQISSRNYTTLPRAFIFYDFYFALVVSSSVVAQVSVTVLQDSCYFSSLCTRVSF